MLAPGLGFNLWMQHTRNLVIRKSVADEAKTGSRLTISQVCCPRLKSALNRKCLCVLACRQCDNPQLHRSGFSSVRVWRGEPACNHVPGIEYALVVPHPS